MGVVYIGDRETGKTHLAMELSNPKSEFVEVTNLDYEFLKSNLYDDAKGGTRPTQSNQATYDEYLEVEVKLPTGHKSVTVDWIDTPGEIWRQSWQADNPGQWQSFLTTVQASEGIVLILAPYREIIDVNAPGVNPEDFVLRSQWCKRFNRWVEFFKNDCPRARHIVLCLNKADLIRSVDLEKESAKLEYNPNGSRMSWQDRHSYVAGRYFRPIQPQIEEINRVTGGLSIRCFVTSIYNRSLLELPWIYLGGYIS